MKRTDPGQYRIRAALERPLRVADGHGQAVRTWEPVGDEMLSVRTLSTGEVARNRVAGIETSHEIKCRYRGDLTTEWRIVIGTDERTRVLDVVGVTNVDERGEELVIRGMERGQ